MSDLNEMETVNNYETTDMESSEVFETEGKIDEIILETAGGSEKTILKVLDTSDGELPGRLLEGTTFEKDISDACARTFKEAVEDSKNSHEINEKLKENQSTEVEALSEKITHYGSLAETESAEKVVTCCSEGKKSACVVKKVINLVEAYTDSSSSTELQCSVAPFESSWSSQENNRNANRIDFQNAIESQPIWKERNDLLPVSTLEAKMDVESVQPPVKQEDKTAVPEIPLITIDENTQPSAPVKEEVSSNTNTTSFTAPGFPLPPPSDQLGANSQQGEVKVKTAEQQVHPEPVPLPVIPPAPRKRGRPRKQVLPNPSPLVESWGPNAQEFPSLETQQEERKRSARAERRQSKKKKLEDSEGDENSTRKRKSAQVAPKKKRRSTYVPKKKLAPQKKKQSEVENFQNFEEETRMSASEGHTGFSSRSGAGDESQGSSATTDGPTRSNINKKGRMEVVTDGCKPVTVQQIVEYYWPPPSSLSHGEKPEGLMIQEQVCEYLGVKSFKRKYPSIKRRPVDMEERNYLQENGYVSENMCDMGLTAVFAADIIEIMYNDFPQKFEEYRKYTREKKAKEQRALREKQAAERADMDPKKEAVESTLSWNSEFNKTRSDAFIFDETMDAPKRTYKSKVLLGNWFQKNCEDEQKLALYVKQKERRNLLILRVRNFFENFLSPITLSMRSSSFSYGDVIQILAPDIAAGPSYSHESSEKGVVLAAAIDSNEIETTLCIFEDMYIIGSPIKEPCARNAFILESCEAKKDGEEVCYGDTFAIRSACGSDFPLYIDVPSLTLGCPTGKSGFPNPQLKLSKGRDARFRVLHRDPTQRASFEGFPCPANERIILMHSPDNTALCIEDEYWKMTLFSYECEVSSHNRFDRQRQHLDQNIFMFMVGVLKY